eukprot:TRINITY_DN47619_c0_g1_i1.p1 TRINITY_DN47619_c0_g1~~TRINITY_DN47619_c0_g1_i1.p1  ORF type:complete len:460 (+),score=76.33 TRINITY_DN47619_c0_g1_i1:37-1416(+)
MLDIVQPAAARTALQSLPRNQQRGRSRLEGWRDSSTLPAMFCCLASRVVYRRWSSHTVRPIARKAQLQLCFDINKTIVMEDSSGRKSERELCNEAIADACWGRVQNDRWTWCGLPLSLQQPDATGNDLMTYSAWITQKHSDTLASASVDREAARAASAIAKQERDRLRGSFAEAYGEAPPEIAAHLGPLLERLVIPESLRNNKEVMRAAGLEGRKTWFLLPSFLQGIRNLLESDHLGRVDVSLHFRTFGKDHAAVAREFNAFLRGEHPLHPGFNSCAKGGSDIDRKVYLEGDSFGAYYRDTRGVILAMGGSGLDELPSVPNRTEALDLAHRAGASVAEGVADIHDLLRERSSKGQTLCLRDHWRYWRDCGESAEAGKLVTVATNDGDHVVFIDDNARDPDGHIVDVRRAPCGSRIPWPSSLSGGNVFRAWPYASLMDEDYFTKLLDDALHRCMSPETDF